MSKEPREFWISKSFTEDIIFTEAPNDDHLTNAGEWLHVREVTPESESELAELRRDRARLEWMIETQSYVGQGALMCCVYDNYDRNITTGIYKTPREAIDAAMKESEK